MDWKSNFVLQLSHLEECSRNVIELKTQPKIIQALSNIPLVASLHDNENRNLLITYQIIHMETINSLQIAKSSATPLTLEDINKEVAYRIESVMLNAISNATGSRKTDHSLSSATILETLSAFTAFTSIFRPYPVNCDDIAAVLEHFHMSMMVIHHIEFPDFTNQNGIIFTQKSNGLFCVCNGLLQDTQRQEDLSARIIEYFRLQNSYNCVMSFQRIDKQGSSTIIHATQMNELVIKDGKAHLLNNEVGSRVVENNPIYPSDTSTIVKKGRRQKFEEHLSNEMSTSNPDFCRICWQV